MQRKNFILTGLLALPVFGIAKSSSSDKPKKPFKVDRDKDRHNSVSYYRGTNLNNLKISKSDTNDALSLYEYVGVEKIGPPLHLHLAQDEIFYVAEGEYRFVVGDQTETLTSGQTIFLPRNIPHTWIQLSDKGRVIYMVTPAGKFEDFFNKLNALKNPPTMEEFDKLSLAHEIRNVGPPLTL
jgi:quercetin dioxygenase-like cupin family protein